MNASIKGTNLDDGRVLVGKDLSAAGTRTANCYVVKTTDTNKWYRFKATVRGNGAQTAAQISYTGAEIPAGAEISPVKAGLVWETRDNAGLFTHWTTWAIPAMATSCSSWAVLLRAMQWLPPKTALPKSFGAGISGQRQRLTGIVSRCRHTRHAPAAFPDISRLTSVRE